MTILSEICEFLERSQGLFLDNMQWESPDQREAYLWLDQALIELTYLRHDVELAQQLDARCLTRHPVRRNVRRRSRRR